MPLPVCGLAPDQSGYTVDEGHTVVSTSLDGGAGRYRADQLGGSFRVPVQWTCDKTNYNYLKAFYRTSLNYGSLPFNIDLMIDSGDLLTYVAYIEADTFRLVSQSGLTWIVGATLEVIPNSAYAAGDAAIIAAGPHA